MKHRCHDCAGSVQSHGHWEYADEAIPGTFPTWAAFFKIVGIALGLMVAQFGLLIVLISQPWR
jgi:hypothetical protein